MKKTVNEYEFINDMTNEGHGFSPEGASILFNHLEELEEETGESIEYDPIGLRCEFNESSTSEVFNDYVKHNLDAEELKEYEEKDPEEKNDFIEEFLNDNTMLCGSYDEEEERFFIYQEF
jgi:hypothetical protein